MTPNNNLSPLPFYRSIDEQYHRLPYTFGAVYPLIAPQRVLLPFQIMFDRHGTNEAPVAITVKVQMWNMDGTLYADLTSAMMEIGLSVQHTDNLTVLLYPANMPLSVNDMPQGRYYLTASVRYSDDNTTDTRYSEVFTVVGNLHGYTKIEWWDRQNAVFDAGIIVYERTGYKNRLYMDTEICRPEYQFDEEGEDRDGYFFPEKQISEKTYRFTLLLPEFLCDVMRLARLSDYVEITDRYGRVYRCDTFLMTVDWSGNADVATVECEFETDTVVKKIGNSVTVTEAGDFSIDFNDDFD